MGGRHQISSRGIFFSFENQEKLFQPRKYQKYISANISPCISSCFHIFTRQADNQHQKHPSSLTHIGRDITFSPPDSFYTCHFLFFSWFSCVWLLGIIVSLYTESCLY